MQTPLLVLIDGSSYLHRAFHALPPLTTSQGEPTGAIYGVISMLKKTIHDQHPNYLAVVFDAKGKNFRHEIYPEYKATRPPMEEELKAQIQPLHAIIQALGIPLLMIPGVEADDVIGSLTRQATQQGMKVIISTGDKDLAQLVSPEVMLINTMTNAALDVSGVKEKFGVAPEQIVDYLTLVGDTSDNVLGVEGVGPKTATKWLEEYGSLNNLLGHQEAMKGKVGENLRASAKRLPLVKKLVTIHDDLNLNVKPEDLIQQEPDRAKLKQLFTHLEFRTWLTDLSGKTNTIKHHIILTEKEFNIWLEKLKHAQAFAFDTETTSLDITQAELVGMSFAITPDEAIYIPFAHIYAGAPAQLRCERVLKCLKPIFADSSKIKLGQNLKYDINILARYDIEVCGICYDTMIEAYILNSSQNQYSKEALALRYLGKTITTYEEIAGKGAKQITFDKIPLATAAPYAALDAALVLQLHGVLWPQIEQSAATKQVLQEIEMPLVSVLAKMEHHGVMIDAKALAHYSYELANKLKTLEQKIYREAAAEFNINSPQQLQEVLYTKLKLPILHKTPTGQPSTAEATLQELAPNYELPQLVLEYRSLSKLKSTYTDALPQQISPTTGRIHTSYNQTVTTTGRLSSTDPNLQNIPVRTEEGRRIRRAFIAPPGCKIVAADYSQIELRIMAHLSQDKNLLAAFAQEQDVHRMVAAEIFGVEAAHVTEEQRRNAKTINFGLIYGMSAFGLAQRIGMSREAAQKYVDLYFARYQAVSVYMEKAREFARKHGFVESIFGRRLYIPEIKTKNYIRRAAAERAAINAPIQGSAADIIKIAMLDIDNWLTQCKFKIAMIMQVHDELVFEVADQRVEEACQEIKKRMERAGAKVLNAPMLVGVGIGSNWEEAH